MVMIVVIMIVVMIMVVVVMVVMVVRRLAEVRLERRLDLRHLDPEARESLFQLGDVEDAHEPLAELRRDMAVAQDVAHDRRFAGRRTVYMEELLRLGDDLVDLPVVGGGKVAAPQRLALGKLARGIGQRELALHLELVGGARGLQFRDEASHAFSTARARRRSASSRRSLEAAKHQRT